MNEPMFKVTIYINSGDHWDHKPLHLVILQMLQHHGLAGGTVLHAVAGFTKKGVTTTTLVDVNGNLPLVIEFIDTQEKINLILPELTKMAAHRLITRIPVEVLNNPD